MVTNWVSLGRALEKEGESQVLLSAARCLAGARFPLGPDSRVFNYRGQFRLVVTHSPFLNHSGTAATGLLQRQEFGNHLRRILRELIGCMEFTIKSVV